MVPHTLSRLSPEQGACIARTLAGLPSARARSLTRNSLKASGTARTMRASNTARLRATLMEVAMRQVLFTALTLLALSACATSGGIMADNPQADTGGSPTTMAHVLDLPGPDNVHS